MHNLINWMRLLDKSMSQSLRIAADEIEELELNEMVEDVRDARQIFRILIRKREGIKKNIGRKYRKLNKAIEEVQ